MGFYINPTDGRDHGKSQWLIDNHGAIEIDQKEACDVLSSTINTMGVVCVVDNGMFEAAAFCFDMREFDAFVETDYDHRPRVWLVMDRKIAENLSGYIPRTNKIVGG